MTHRRCARFRNLATFIGLFAFALPLVATLASMLAAYPRGDHDQHASVWLHIALAHALGYLVFAPVWFRPRARWSTLQRMFVPHSWPAISALAAVATIGYLWNAFGGVSYMRPLLLLARSPRCVRASRGRTRGSCSLRSSRSS